ncbi:hypothetical protein AHiyo8_01300 [Arthrobacter sp. Hiyo8]|uniref:hypothetical protein n=1 Tax=Arthrobacter sp. Hiyo1 TaxID=1588020 RepID=UPI00068399E6|nr:hypothetical protein [Arthrobacter sp. Hiyo1]BAS11827.1 hypothetical protein AHiyo8_01300 [Arthrobacter sp. Hiyo8]GAP61315.1 hypothetical protein AHiyo1_50050 [Arthrobacter sp. Hiyo1]
MANFRPREDDRKLVRVEGRDDIGEFIDRGHNVGTLQGIYCVGVHFPKDGLCAYYASDRVTYVVADGTPTSA